MAVEPAVEIDTPPFEASLSVYDSGGVVRAAAIISLGNVLSRVLGLARESVIADLFGATGNVSIFRVAATLIQTLYDFLVGGMVSAALVPVFSEHAERREDLWQLASTVLSVLLVLLVSAVLLLELLAPQLVSLLGPGYDPTLQAAAVQMVRLILPAVVFLGVAGTLTGLLYSLKRFTFPAFTTAAYNAAIIVVAIVLYRLLPEGIRIYGLLVGILVGAASQVILQLPGLRDARIRWSIDLHNPALLQIVRLYVPVLGGLLVSIVGVTIDRNLASRTGNQSLAWMQDATVLVQFPLGLVVTAISFAILPHLSRAVAQEDFRATLALGLKLVLLLILPATLGLFLLARPIVGWLFERGAFVANDTFNTSSALQLYLIGLPFAAIDQPLVFAFYARKNTLTPNLVAVVGVSIYVVVALLLIRPLGMLGLVLANSAQLTGHALIMLYLTKTRLGGLTGQGFGAMLAKVAVAISAMAIVVFMISTNGFESAGIFAPAARVLLPGTPGVIIYLLGLRVLRVREAEELWSQVRLRLKH
jgi:putative peptidoglycan lipid II flippase